MLAILNGQIDSIKPEFVVLDTETMGHKQCEFFTWLAQYLPKGTPRTPEMLLLACEPDVVETVKTLKNGKTRSKTEKVPKAFAKTVLDHCNEVCRSLGKKEATKPGKQLFENTWKLFDGEALLPHQSKVYNLQIGVYCDGTLHYYSESSAEPESQFPEIIEAAYRGYPLLGQNIDFDLRQIGHSFNLYPHPQTVIFDTQIIESLFVADSDRDRMVGLADLCAYYDVPEQFRKTGTKPQFVDWRDPGPDEIKYAINDILSCAYIFMCQRANPVFKEIQQTLLLESSIRTNLAYASVKGVPIHNTVTRIYIQNALTLAQESLDELYRLARGLGMNIPEGAGLGYVGQADFTAMILNGLSPLMRDGYKPLDGLDKKKVYQHDSFINLPVEWRNFLNLLFKLRGLKKQVSSLTKIIGKTEKTGVTWLHPTYGTVPPPKAGKKNAKKDDDADESWGGTKSGRMSTSGQLSPLTMSEVDKQIVVAPQGQVIVSFDLSGIELRLAAALAHDHGLIEMINNGIDVYRVVASKAFNIPYESIAKKSVERNLGKEAVLAFIFEALIYTLQMQVRVRTEGMMHVSDGDAKKLYEAFWAIAPGIKRWAHDLWVQGCIRGFYSTAKGRRRYFNMEDYRYELSKKEKWGKTLWKPPSLTFSNGEMTQDSDALFRASCPQFKRLCGNHVDQSTAGEGFKLGVSRMPFREYGWGVIGFIHDANDLLINETDTSWAVDFIPHTMLQSMAEVLHNAGGAPIALGVEGTIGKCWAKFNKDRAKEYVVPDDTPGWYQTHLGEWKLHNGNFTRIS